jgi:hypothetical protein
MEQILHTYPLSYSESHILYSFANHIISGLKKAQPIKEYSIEEVYELLGKTYKYCTGYLTCRDQELIHRLIGITTDLVQKKLGDEFNIDNDHPEHPYYNYY